MRVVVHARGVSAHLGHPALLHEFDDLIGVDDVEFALGSGVANVRTSSRIGYTDMGVNAKRFNWFADRLGGTAGWATRPLRSKGHEEYFSLNGVSDKDMATRASTPR